MRIENEFEAIFLEPEKYWRLSLDVDGRLRIASVWQRNIQWVSSFFTQKHKEALIHRVQGLLNQMQECPTLEQQIIIEKVSRLVWSESSWLFRQIALIKKPTEISIEDRNKIDSQFQPYEENGRYYNHQGEKIWRQFLKTLYLLFPGAFSKPSHEKLESWNRVDWTPVSRSEEPIVTWLGHASLLIQGENINLLLDPSFEFVSPCFRRHTAPPIPFEKLPCIDVLGISHNHGDHFDQSHLRLLKHMQPFAFVPHRLDGWFKQNGYKQVVGAKWWQQTKIDREGKSITVTAIPAIHGSQTSLSDLNRTLWMGLLIEIGGTKIYFAGDTAYHSEMLEEIKNHFGEIDIACLPIAPENEREVHFDHIQALDAFEKLGAKKMIPIHHGAYRMGKEKIEDPIKIFMEAAKKRNLIDKVINLRLGETHKVLEDAATQSFAKEA